MGTAKVSTERPKRKRAELIEIDRIEDVPHFGNDDEAAEYWDTHAPSERFLEEAEIEPPDWLPPVRERANPLSIRFDADTLARLRALAKKKHKGYQTLLKEFVMERLYEEEKREGIVSEGPREATPGRGRGR